MRRALVVALAFLVLSLALGLLRAQRHAGRGGRRAGARAHRYPTEIRRKLGVGSAIELLLCTRRHGLGVP